MSDITGFAKMQPSLFKYELNTLMAKKSENIKNIVGLFK